MSDLLVRRIENGQFAQNCWLLADPDAGEAVIVDPGEEWERILAEAGEYKVTGIWLTHAHVDHVLGVGGVREATGAPIYLHPADRMLYDRAPQQGLMFGVHAGPMPQPDHELAPGDEMTVGRHRFTVRHAPGHSPGHVVFVGDGVVVAGDVLFQGSVGRTDLPGGDTETLMRSIREELLTLPDETVVLSGHGPETTIGRERASNPFLNHRLP